MGSGSSSNIKTIHIDQDNESSKDIPKKNKSTSPHGKILPQSEQQLEEKDPDEEESASIERLTQQLCESESQRLDLEDQVETLMKELDYLNSQNVQKEGDQKPCEETVHVKDQYISKIEKEKKELEVEINKMKQKQRRKQKQFNTQMAEYKQEVNFQLMELQEEISRLKTENKQLKDVNNGKGKVSPVKSFIEEDKPKLPGGEKMALILELSEQVAEQEDKINKLEHKLNEKDQLVCDLRTKLKNSAQYLSVLDKTKDRSVTNEIGDVVDRDKPNRNKNASSGMDTAGKAGLKKKVITVKSENSKLKKENDIDGLFTLDEESSENEEDNLMKLSSNLLGVRSYSKISTSPDLTDDRKTSTVSTATTHFPEPLEDANGRDSGLGSAGKREENTDKNVESGKFARTVTSWKDNGHHSFESGSGLSDSDFEQYGPGSSKVYSAPPKLQNGTGGGRLKKKSSSLRRHASRKEDRPPRPGMAFVDNAGTVNSDDHIVNKLTPIISPVEVS